MWGSPRVTLSSPANVIGSEAIFGKILGNTNQNELEAFAEVLKMVA